MSSVGHLSEGDRGQTRITAIKALRLDSGFCLIRIDTDAAEREKMVAKTRRTSVPQIFIGETHVGGYDDMMALHRAGKLEPLLNGAGA